MKRMTIPSTQSYVCVLCVPRRQLWPSPLRLRRVSSDARQKRGNDSSFLGVKIRRRLLQMDSTYRRRLVPLQLQWGRGGISTLICLCLLMNETREVIPLCATSGIKSGRQVRHRFVFARCVRLPCSSFLMSFRVHNRHFCTEESLRTIPPVSSTTQSYHAYPSHITYRVANLYFLALVIVQGERQRPFIDPPLFPVLVNPRMVTPSSKCSNVDSCLQQSALCTALPYSCCAGN